ncbi:MAG: hypothetical protein AAGF96_19800 [Bacteroidota bacterium]
MRTTIHLGNALKGLGICALIGGVTTFLNTMAPKFYKATGFDAQMELIYNPIYAARQWVLLVHPYVTLMLALGLLLALFHRGPGRTSSAFIFAFAEKMTEFLLGTLILFVVNGVWKTGYLAGDGLIPAQVYKSRIESFYDLLGGCFFLLWIMYILSTGLFAACLKWNNKKERLIVITSVVTILLTVCMMLGRYAGQSAWTTPFIKYGYGPILTLHRVLIGLWLIQEGRRWATQKRRSNA